MNITENILTKFKRDLRENWKEVIIYILDCFVWIKDMSDDDGFIACKCYWL